VVWPAVAAEVILEPYREPWVQPESVVADSLVLREEQHLPERELQAVQDNHVAASASEVFRAVVVAVAAS